MLSWLIKRLKPNISSVKRLGVWSISVIEWASGCVSSWRRFRIVLKLVHSLNLCYFSYPCFSLNSFQQIYKNKIAGVVVRYLGLKGLLGLVLLLMAYVLILIKLLNWAIVWCTRILLLLVWS
jgi:hypothetical protein